MLGVDACEFGGQVLELLWIAMCYRVSQEMDDGAEADREDGVVQQKTITKPPGKRRMKKCTDGLIGDEEDAPVECITYNAPAQKTLGELQELDKDDESLVRYKMTLLGSHLPCCPDVDIPNVQVTSLSLLCDEASTPITMDLTGDLNKLKDEAVTLKEGVQYRIKILFKVNREIVPGLKYYHVISRKGVTVDKDSYMVGSYGPRDTEHEFISCVEEAPKGMMARGLYKIKSRFIDDDKNVCLAWEWSINIKKDWE